METIVNNPDKNILGKKPSINTSTCNCRNKEACTLNRQCQIVEIVYEGTLSSNQPNCKEIKYFGLRKNLSKDAYTTTIYLSEMNFIKTTPNFLRDSGKSR